jgi:hypothetical protein
LAKGLFIDWRFDDVHPAAGVRAKTPGRASYRPAPGLVVHATRLPAAFAILTQRLLDHG